MQNEAVLTGTVCKPPVYRQTPLGRQITDLCLAVPRLYRRTDYIPCILWGRTAHGRRGIPHRHGADAHRAVCRAGRI